MPRLDGKISLVTGGTNGIGLAAANALAKEGAYVFITGHRERELTTAVQQIGRNATGVRGDVSNAHDLDRLLAQIRDEKGRLDILFVNAGIAKYAALGNITEERFDSIVTSPHA
jgi:NAD(P)-dependent dehydrogenase (short-subunit alcohol dehydrogenase family)